jgi:hypothetical protein
MHPYLSRALAADMIRDRQAEAAALRRAREARRHQRAASAPQAAAPAGGGLADLAARWRGFPRRRPQQPAVAAADCQDERLAA